MLVNTCAFIYYNHIFILYFLKFLLEVIKIIADHNNRKFNGNNGSDHYRKIGLYKIKKQANLYLKL